MNDDIDECELGCDECDSPMSEECSNYIADDDLTLCDGCYNDYLDDGEMDCEYDRDDLIDGVGFADPGGHSSLRAETVNNPRNRPCPSCHAANVLTPADVRAGYQCNRCADIAEGRGGY